MPRFGLPAAIALLLSSCGGGTREDILGEGASTLGGAGEGGTGGSGGIGGVPQAGGGSAGTGTSGGSAGTGASGGSSGGAGGTANNNNNTTAGTDGNGECMPSGGPGDAGAPALDPGLDGGLHENLISNPSFESGHSGWVPQGTLNIVDVTENPHTGLKCIGAKNRSQVWMGPMLPIDTLVTAGTSYDVSAWVRVSAESQVNVIVKQTCQGEPTTFLPVDADAATVCGWTLLRGQFEAPSCTVTDLSLVIEGPSSGVDVFVDDIALFAID